MATIRDFNYGPLAASYLFDTSFLVHLIVEGQAFHDESRAFFERLRSEAGARRYYVSAHAYAEFANAAARILLIRGGMTPAQAQEHLRQQGPQAVAGDLRQLLEDLDEALDSLGDDVFQVRLDYDHWIRSLDAVTGDSLQPYDAIHLASARYARCADIVTFDTGFERVGDMTLWRAAA